MSVDRLQIDGPRSRKANTIQMRQASCRDSREITQIAPRIASLKKHDFELRILESHLRRDFKVAPIVAHFADQREGTTLTGAVESDIDFLEAPAQELHPAQKICQLSQPHFQRIMELVNNLRVEPGARH
jgi:hypothetical protein